MLKDCYLLTEAHQHPAQLLTAGARVIPKASFTLQVSKITDAIKSSSFRLMLQVVPGRAEGSPDESRENLHHHQSKLTRDVSGRGKCPPEPHLDWGLPWMVEQLPIELRFLSHKQLLELLLALTFSCSAN